MRERNPNQNDQQAEISKMHICTNPECCSPLVQLVDHREVDGDEDSWEVDLWCPECDDYREDQLYSNAECMAFDEELTRGEQALIDDLNLYTAELAQEDLSRMRKEVGVFVMALDRNHILPEDFGRPA